MIIGRIRTLFSREIFLTGNSFIKNPTLITLELNQIVSGEQL
jgi:hypothetical protein